MKQIMTNWMTLTAIAVFGLSTSFANAQESAKRVDPSGTWRFEYDLEGTTVKDSLQLQLGKDGALTGTYRGRSEEPVEIKCGKVEGDKVTVEMAIEFQGIPIEVKFDGQMKDDDIKGIVVATTPEGNVEFDWIAKRSVEAEDVVGIWELEIDAVETILEPILEIKLDGKDLKATYKDPDSGIEELEAKELRIEDNHLRFVIESEFQGNSLKADFKGRPYGSKISGTIDYDLSGQTGEVEFEGVRKAEEKKQEKSEDSATEPQQTKPEVKSIDDQAK